MAIDEDQKMEDSGIGADVLPPPENKAPMKFSFSVPKSSSSSRPSLFPKADRQKDADEADEVEYVSVFDGQGRPAQPVKVIPLPEKSWRPEKRMKNIMIASEDIPSTEERFEVETLSAGPQPSVQYGLQLKKKPSDSAEAPPQDAVDRDLQRYREDIAILPDEMSVDAYDNVPVEEFGEALLRGMGWEKDKPIGRNTTTIAKPVVPVRRAGREGLGAIPAPQHDKIKKFIKPGESRETKLRVGRIICIVAGAHAASRGQVAEVGETYYTISLLESGERVRVKEEELAEVGSLEEEKAIRKLATLRIEQSNGIDDGGKCPFEEVNRRRHAEGETRPDRCLSDDTRDASDQRKSEERGQGNHRRDGRSRSTDEVDYDNNSRHRSRKVSSDRNYGDERGIPDGKDESRQRRKQKSRREDTDDRKEPYEEAASRQGQRGREERSSRHGKREDRYTSDSKYGKSTKTELKGHSSDVYKKEKSSADNMAVGRGLRAEDAVGHSEQGMQSWLDRDIRVRIIDKRAYGDKYYLQKARVVDVVSPSLCDIQMDEGGRILERVKQEHLETALPKRGGHVLVVGGKYRGQFGRLQERDSEKGIGRVQMEENSEILTFDLDHLAEFVGMIHEMEQ